MPTRPTSGKKSGKKDGKKGKNKGAKTGVVDPHQEQIDGLVREREEIRSKLNLVCTKIMENINLDDYKNDIDLTKQQPSDLPIDIIYSMIDQICYYRVAFLNLFQEADDNERISVHKKITQLSIDDPDLFRKHLTPYQRLTFVVRERDVWKENAHLLQEMYQTIVDQLEMETFKKSNGKTEDILKTHRLNLEDICFIFSLPRILSINDAQKLRAKRPVSNSHEREQSAGLTHDQQQEITDVANTSLNEVSLRSQLSHPNSAGERRNNHSSSLKRSVSFADEVNVSNQNNQTDPHQITGLPSTGISNEQILEENHHPVPMVISSSSVISHHNPIEEKFADSDYHSLSSSSFHHPHAQQQQHDIASQSKYNLPTKYRLPLAKDVYVKKMDPNLRMLIIKELSRSGHVERPLSRMSSTRGRNNQTNSLHSRQQQTDHSIQIVLPEWIQLARLVRIDEAEIEHWLSQNLQYPAGRVISTWCNSDPEPTVANLHCLVTSNELNRHDLARYIETMYITE